MYLYLHIHVLFITDNIEERMDKIEVVEEDFGKLTLSDGDDEEDVVDYTNSQYGYRENDNFKSVRISSGIREGLKKKVKT